MTGKKEAFDYVLVILRRGAEHFTRVLVNGTATPSPAEEARRREEKDRIDCDGTLAPTQLI